MKYLVLMVLSLNVACATSFEKCQRGDEWTRYGSMDACVADKDAATQRRREFLKNAFTIDYTPQAPAPIQSSQPTNCIAYNSGNMVNVNCY